MRLSRPWTCLDVNEAGITENGITLLIIQAYKMTLLFIIHRFACFGPECSYADEAVIKLSEEPGVFWITVQRLCQSGCDLGGVLRPVQEVVDVRDLVRSCKQVIDLPE